MTVEPANKLSLAQVERFSYLIEECSEVIKATTKILRHGFYASDFSTGKEVKYNNRADLEREIVDVLKAVRRLIENQDISMSIIALMDQAEQKGLTNCFFHHQEDNNG